MIVDWKTTRKRTEPSILRQRLQTLVYPYVLVEASAKLLLWSGQARTGGDAYCLWARRSSPCAFATTAPNTPPPRRGCNSFWPMR
ncbi:MAG: PD-(D/E)XK nuclease family protein [Caldilineaceae bacterium]